MRGLAPRTQVGACCRARFCERPDHPTPLTPLFLQQYGFPAPESSPRGGFMLPASQKINHRHVLRNSPCQS